MNNTFFLICGFSLVICLLKNNKKRNVILEFLNNHTKLLFIIIVIISFLLYLYKIDSIPVGLNADEAGMAYDAYSISHYGVDRFLYKNPIYFINYGDGQNALYTYITSILLKFFNYNLLIIRLPAAIFGLLSIIFCFKLVKENKDKEQAILTLVIMLITPFFIMKSRWALESYLFLPLLIISLYYYLHAIKTSKKSYYFLAGLLFGITLYTYAISYIVIFVFVVTNSLYLLIKKKTNISNLLVFGIPLFLLSIPLIILLLINNNIISHEIRTSLISIPKLLNYRGGDLSFSNIKGNLADYNIFKVIFIDDDCSWNSIPKYGTLYNISGLLVALGLIISLINVIKSLKKKEYSLDIPIFTIFITMFFLSLCLSNVNINKVNCIYLPLIYYVGVGLIYIFKKSDIIGGIILCLYFVFFISFTKYYYNDYATDTKDTTHFISNDFSAALNFAKEKSQNKKIISIDSHTISQPYIYVLLEEQTNPHTFNKYVKRDNEIILSYKKYEFYIDVIDNKHIYISKDELNTNMFVKSYGVYKVYYLDTSI